jgi:hypothetical protein
LAEDQGITAEIEENYSLHIATIAGGILKQEAKIVLVLSKVLQ